jgi:hypothetical protein
VFADPVKRFDILRCPNQIETAFGCFPEFLIVFGQLVQANYQPGSPINAQKAVLVETTINRWIVVSDRSRLGTAIMQKYSDNKHKYWVQHNHAESRIIHD